jgi:hypothetical protein
LARQLGLARAGLGASLLAAPRFGTRLMGLDSGTARRMVWLTRMAAARDLALGAGTLAALRDGRDVARWLAVGAAADLADTVILADATRRGSFSRVRGSALVAGAAGGALVGAAAALGMRRR